MYIRIVQISYMKKVFLLIALASLLQGCRSTPTTIGRAITPIGRWSISVASSSANYYGVELLEDGRARSINLITMHYEQWSQRGDTLILSGQHSTTGSQQNFSDTMKILSLPDSKMVLQLQDMKWELNKIPE